MITNPRCLPCAHGVVLLRVAPALLWLVLAICTAGQSRTRGELPPPDLADEKPRYFPKNVFSEFPDVSGFKVCWFAKHLQAMDEPSLLNNSTDNSLVAYRFLWLRSFHHPIVVRLTIRPDGAGQLASKEAGGTGG